MTNRPAGTGFLQEYTGLKAMQTVAWASGSLIGSVCNTVDATAANKTPALPTPLFIGQVLTVEKSDSTLNTVAISGTIRGSAGSLTLSLTNESVMFEAESLTSWRPVADHKSLTQLATLFGVAMIRPSGDTTGVKDLASIQAGITAAAAIGGQCRLLPGAQYYINAPLVIPVASNHMQFLPGFRSTTITLVAGSNCPMLWDASHANGDLTVPSPTGSYEIGDCTFDRGGNAGVGNNTHSLILGGNGVKVGKLRLKSTAGKYMVLPQNITNLTIDELWSDGVASSPIQIQGPASDIEIGLITGQSGDDMFAITPCDYVAYNWGNEGNVARVHVKRIAGSTFGSRSANILSGTGPGSVALSTTDITIDEIVGTQAAANGQAAVIIGEDNGSPGTTGGFLDRITIGKISVAVTKPTQAIVNLQGYAASQQMGSLTVHQIDIVTDVDAIVSCTSKWSSTKISNIVGTIGSTHTVTTTNLSPVVVDTSILATQFGESVTGTGIPASSFIGTVTPGVGFRLSSTSGTQTDVNASASGTVSAIIVPAVAFNVIQTASSSTAILSRIMLDNVDITSPGVIGSLVKCTVAGATIGDVFVNRFYMNGFANFIDTISSLTVHASDGAMVGNGLIFNIRSPAAVTVASWSGIVTAGTNSSITSTGTLRSKDVNFTGDPGNAQFVKTVGDMCTTRTTFGGIANGTPVICDGTTWRNAITGAVKSGTATLVAGTVTVADTSTTANTDVRLRVKTPGGTVGAPFISAKVVGTSFTITSTSASDTSVVAYDVVTY